MSKSQPITKRKPRDHPRGRVPLDVDDLRVKIFYDAPKGLTEEKLAEFLGISNGSYYSLKANNLDFLEAVKHYKKVSPIEVLSSFKKIAVGYSFDETERQLRKTKTGKYKMVVTKIVTKHLAPNAGACWNYLKSQMSGEFKEKIENTHSFEGVLDNITFVIKGKS